MTDERDNDQDRLSPEPLSTYLDRDGNEKPPEQGPTVPEPPSDNDKEAFTKDQLEHQKDHRVKPKLEMVLTPNGPEYNEINKALAEKQEAQIQYREQVLERLNNLARDDFNMTQQHYDRTHIDQDRDR